jgi:NAD(P)-dependent dehydrogenase (short-subunit alcohol dehydrogenase family)
MDLGLRNKVTLVTAATGGLGFAIAKEMAAEGAIVVLSGRSDAKVESAVSAILDATGGIVEGVRADLSSRFDIDSLVAHAEESHGHIDVLINNSGGPATAPFVELSDEDWIGAFDAKFLPQVRLARAVFPGMAKRKWGRIITLIGTHAHSPHAYAVTAGVVNAALLNLTKALAEIGAPDNVLVNAINPGWIDTERMAYVVKRQARDAKITEEESRRKICSEIQLGRPGTPEDIAAAAAFLASSRAGFITGSYLDIDGGMTRTL